MQNTNAEQNAVTDATASAPRRMTYRWRVVDIVVASVIGVAASLIFFAWNQLYTPVTAPLESLLPGSNALLYGIWLFAGVLGGLIIRKPGAAIYTETVAAAVSLLIGGAEWGFFTLEAGLVQGLGAELIFLVFLYRVWKLPVAALAGAAAGVAMAINDLVLYYPAAGTAFQVIYAVCAIVSGAMIAGVGSWLLMRGIAKTGVLSRFAAGRAERPVDLPA